MTQQELKASNQKISSSTEQWKCCKLFTRAVTSLPVWILYIRVFLFPLFCKYVFCSWSLCVILYPASCSSRPQTIY